MLSPMQAADQGTAAGEQHRHMHVWTGPQPLRTCCACHYLPVSHAAKMPHSSLIARGPLPSNAYLDLLTQGSTFMPLAVSLPQLFSPAPSAMFPVQNRHRAAGYLTREQAKFQAAMLPSQGVSRAGVTGLSAAALRLLDHATTCTHL